MSIFLKEILAIKKLAPKSMLQYLTILTPGSMQYFFYYKNINKIIFPIFLNEILENKKFIPKYMLQFLFKLTTISMLYIFYYKDITKNIFSLFSQRNTSKPEIGY